ncbi:MAG: methyltransferase domain-containing protein [Spiribacter salinus]|uniref:Methyltransferase domain-containing protein n=1 Tax=Spiribacter salinus TaxID=1335746 RepID=A0A540VQ82_9GAMM|nr:MAG: methyltransferase domain-containing protein [Spiribacter salinus]
MASQPNRTVRFVWRRRMPSSLSGPNLCMLRSFFIHITEKPMKADFKKAVKTAEDYYNSADADAFYAAIWGGEDIHVGLYESDGEDIAVASARTVHHMASKLDLKPGARVIDIGAGYGGAARYLAREIGAHVTCLNLSEKENARNRRLTAEQGLEEKIEVVHGLFEDIPFPDNSFDVVWSQEAILHSGDRTRVLKEVSRVLKPGGDFIFTDPMQANDIDDAAEFEPIYERIHLPDMDSIGFYLATLEELGFDMVEIEDLTHQLRNHYARVREELKSRRHALQDQISPDYTERMLNGLSRWVEAADAGQLSWGVLHFRKR